MRQRDKGEGKVTIAFSINTKKHPEIWAWLQSQPKYGKSKAIREALKAYIKAKKEEQGAALFSKPPGRVGE